MIDPGPDLASHRDALRGALAASRSPTSSSPTATPTTRRSRPGWPRRPARPRWPSARTSTFAPRSRRRPRPPRRPSTRPSARRSLLPTVTSSTAPGWTFEAVHTPGHTANHTCWALHEESALFTGDHVMGWSTSVVGPPGGDVGGLPGQPHQGAGPRRQGAVAHPRSAGARPQAVRRGLSPAPPGPRGADPGLSRRRPPATSRPWWRGCTSTCAPSCTNRRRGPCSASW